MFVYSDAFFFTENILDLTFVLAKPDLQINAEYLAWQHIYSSFAQFNLGLDFNHTSQIKCLEWMFVQFS